MLIHSQTSWPYLISELLVAGSSWPRTFFTPQMFLFSISLLFVNKYVASYFIAKYIIATNLTICVISIGSSKKATKKIIKRHALTIDFVYIATLVFAYVYAYHYFCKCT